MKDVSGEKNQNGISHEGISYAIKTPDKEVITDGINPPVKKTADQIKGRANRVVKVIKERCPQNHICPAIKVCPVNAIKQAGFAAPAIKEEICIKCGKCTDFCPMEALVFA